MSRVQSSDAEPTPVAPLRSVQVRRALVLSLVALAVASMSARPMSGVGAADRAGFDDGLGIELAQPPTTAEQIDDVLAMANPGLAHHERFRIGSALLRSADHYGLAPDLVLAVILVESDARPEAHSPKGALGLMQVMPHMMTPMGLAGNAMTVESNIEAGCFILADNIRRWGFERGISAYFWGTDVRDGRYLAKVLAARDRVRELSES
jgi:soluble lytic murein transglycosylase-like protein